MDVKSSISYIEKVGMYKIDLGFYTKYFEFGIYNYQNNSNYTFGNSFSEINIEKDLKLENKIVGITSFFDYFLVCFFDLKNFSNEYFLVKDANIFSYNLKNKDYLFIIYTDKNNEEKIYHNCNLDDFEIIYKNKNFEIINKIIDISVFRKIINKQFILSTKNLNIGFIVSDEILHDENINRNHKSIPIKREEGNLFNIIDLYYFDDLFSSNNTNIFEELIFLNDFISDKNCNIRIEKLENPLFPKYKIKIFCDINYLKNNGFLTYLKNNGFLTYLKLFLSINPEQYLSYTVENNYLENLCNDFFENISHLKLEEIHIDFKNPENIFSYDDNFGDFQKSINKLKYIIYIMKYNLDKINEIGDLSGQNEYIEIAFTRLEIQKENLETLIEKYTGVLKELLLKILFVRAK